MCDGGDCRCEVSLQSYSLSNVELGLRNAHFWFFCDFCGIFRVIFYKLFGVHY